MKYRTPEVLETSVVCQYTEYVLITCFCSKMVRVGRVPNPNVPGDIDCPMYTECSRVGTSGVDCRIYSTFQGVPGAFIDCDILDILGVYPRASINCDVQDILGVYPGYSSTVRI